MKQKKIELANLAWISHFWAFYNKLPETFKEGFYQLVFNIAKEIEEEGEEQIVNNKYVASWYKVDTGRRK